MGQIYGGSTYGSGIYGPLGSLYGRGDYGRGKYSRGTPTTHDVQAVIRVRVGPIAGLLGRDISAQAVIPVTVVISASITAGPLWQPEVCPPVEWKQAELCHG